MLLWNRRKQPTFVVFAKSIRDYYFADEVWYQLKNTTSRNHRIASLILNFIRKGAIVVNYIFYHLANNSCEENGSVIAVLTSLPALLPRCLSLLAWFCILHACMNEKYKKHWPTQLYHQIFMFLSSWSILIKVDYLSERNIGEAIKKKNVGILTERTVFDLIQLSERSLINWKTVRNEL